MPPSATLVNRTSHLADLQIARDGAGGWGATVVLKATYAWDARGNLTPVPAEPLLTADQYAGDPASTGLLRAAELGPQKLRIDVLVAGALVFPAPIDTADVVMAIGTRLSKSARVFGDRRWYVGPTRELVPSRPHPTARLPICWERCYGGTVQEQPEHFVSANPVGRGLVLREEALNGQAVPNFEDPGGLLSSWRDRPLPRGFGPVAPHWQSRRRHAGTYDDQWNKTRRPLPPLDFDRRFFNVAPEDQQLDGYPAGDEVRLTNMTAWGRDRFRLPDLSLPVSIVTESELFEDITGIDTIIIEPESRRLTLLARAAAPLTPDPTVLRRIIVGPLTKGWRTAIMKGKQYLGLSGTRA